MLSIEWIRSDGLPKSSCFECQSLLILRIGGGGRGEHVCNTLLAIGRHVCLSRALFAVSRQQKGSATMQTNRQSKQIPRVVRFFLGSLVALITIGGVFVFLMGVLMRILQRNRKLFKNRTLLKIMGPYMTFTRKTGGSASSPFALLIHVGRKSGRVHETPLGACAFKDGFLLPLAYGPSVDWCRNVMTAGTCTLKWRGQEYALERPEIITDPEAMRAWPLSQRFWLRIGGVHQFLWVRKPHEIAEKGSADMPSSVGEDEQFPLPRVSRLMARSS